MERGMFTAAETQAHLEGHARAGWSTLRSLHPFPNPSTCQSHESRWWRADARRRLLAEGGIHSYFAQLRNNLKCSGQIRSQRASSVCLPQSARKQTWVKQQARWFKNTAKCYLLTTHMGMQVHTQAHRCTHTCTQAHVHAHTAYTQPCAHVYTHMHTEHRGAREHMHVHTGTCVHGHTCAHNIYTCIYRYTCVRTHTRRARGHAYAHMHVHTHAHRHAHAHIHTHSDPLQSPHRAARQWWQPVWESWLLGVCRLAQR